MDVAANILFLDNRKQEVLDVAAAASGSAPPTTAAEFDGAFAIDTSVEDAEECCRQQFEPDMVSLCQC